MLSDRSKESRPRGPGFVGINVTSVSKSNAFILQSKTSEIKLFKNQL
jgi:hypothetical protein